MRIGSLFSGAGGLDMAVEQVFGARTAWHSEIDKAASKVLAHRWPSVPNLGDITAVDWSAVEPIDVLCGGFPCQDVSAAGKRAGIKDGTRSGLWSVFADAIAALRPPIVVIENVRGLLSAKAHRAMESTESAMGDATGGGTVLRAAGAVLGDLADLGYDAQWATVAAAALGAPHRRERVFILAVAPDAKVEPWCVGNGDDVRTGSGARRHPSATRRGGDAADTSSYGRDEGRPESARLVGGSDAAVSGDGPVELLPTPSVTDSAGGHLTRGGARSNEKLLPGIVRDLLPTPRTRDGKGATASRAGDNKHDLPSALLPTPAASDGARGPDYQRRNRDGSGADDLITTTVEAVETGSWGKYGPAIRRWEALTRVAPAPTEPNKNGNPRLAAAFSEWMQGWPAGWVTDPAIGISRNEQLRIIGNGVCPQQAYAALVWLLSVCEVAA